MLFADIGVCSLKVNIKKIKQFIEPTLSSTMNTDKVEKLSCIMNLQVKSLFGNFYLVKKMS